jgi:hypothetical protein
MDESELSEALSAKFKMAQRINELNETITDFPNYI